MRTNPLVVALLIAAAAGCSQKGPPLVSEVVAVPVRELPADGSDAIWKRAPVCRVELVLQDIVEPRLLRPSTTAVRVQAATDGSRIAFHLAWDDSTRNDLPGAARFCDACAVQLPAAVAADLPAPQMGELGRGVEISYWSSAWQAMVDGRKPEIRSYYPNATVDHYPFEAASLKEGDPARAEMATRYAPAKAMANFMAGDGVHAVQDLIAEGPGTITSVEGGRSSGKGSYAGAGWDVVISRAAPRELGNAGRTQVAFAVWQGERQEVGARKMRSVWTPFRVEAAK